MSSPLDQAIAELVLANRALDYEKVLDAYGHVSVRHPTNPSQFLLSQSKSAGLVTSDDIIAFDLAGEPVANESRPLYLERFIHAGLYRARSDIGAVVHSHADDTLPFGITGVALRPVIHSASNMGEHVPIWDIAEKFGDTNLLVRSIEQAADLASTLGDATVVLMRGHGFSVVAPTLIEAVRLAVYTPKNARVLTTALGFGGAVRYLSRGEIDQRRFVTGKSAQASDYDPNGSGMRRAWNYWIHRTATCTCKEQR
jgi:HCOMODA/2-hydroxy-3-carboxy-muconic semialdehyde decarboxylase